MAQKPGSLAPMHRNATPVPLGRRGRFGPGGWGWGLGAGGWGWGSLSLSLMMPPTSRAEGLAWGLGEDRSHLGSIRPEPIAASLVRVVGLLPSPGRSPHAGAVTSSVRRGRAALSRLSQSGVRGATRPTRRYIRDGARAGAGEALKRCLRFPTVFPPHYTPIGGSTSAPGPS